VAWAQTGTLDQTSPIGGATFNLDASVLVWQQQARAGLAGQLEGVVLTFVGDAGAQADVRIRVGPAWNTTATVYAATVTKAVAGNEPVFLNVTAANVHLAVGDTIAIETQGNGTGMNISGSYVAPPGTPAYPEALFLLGNNYADGGWRHGFQTYMLTGSSCYANCDASTAPPILNVLDFSCFLQKFAAGNAYANCDASTTAPTLNVLDFSCFLQKFAAGCP
jgi:hypothetical protein